MWWEVRREVEVFSFDAECRDDVVFCCWANETGAKDRGFPVRKSQRGGAGGNVGRYNVGSHKFHVAWWLKWCGHPRRRCAAARFQGLVECRHLLFLLHVPARFGLSAIMGLEGSLLTQQPAEVTSNPTTRFSDIASSSTVLWRTYGHLRSSLVPDELGLRFSVVSLSPRGLSHTRPCFARLSRWLLVRKIANIRAVGGFLNGSFLKIGLYSFANTAPGK